MTRTDEAHDEVLAEFFRKVWDPEATPGSVARGRAESARRNPVAPGEEAPRFIVVAEGRVIGYVSTIPVLASCGGHTAPAHWIKGLMVVPEHRNGPVGFMVLREAMKYVGKTWTFALAVEASPRRLFHALGHADLGVLPEYVKLLRGDRVIEGLARDETDVALPPAAGRALRAAARTRLRPAVGAMVEAAVGAWTFTVGSAPRGLSTDDGRPIDPAFVDALWSETRSDGLWAPAERTGEYLDRRYGEDPTYRVRTVRSAGTSGGLVVVRLPREGGADRLGGVRIATLSDVLYPRERTALGLAALRAAEEVAVEAGADALLCAASDPALRRLLVRRAFLPVPSRMHFLVRGPDGEAEFPHELSSWWITRGDSRTDEVF